MKRFINWFRGLTDQKKALVIIGSLLVASLFVGGGAVSTTEPKVEETTEEKVTEVPEEKKERDLSTTALAISQIYMKEVLVSPATADFASRADGSNYGKMGEDTYYINSFVDSQNSFGALIRTEYNMQLRFKGGDEYVPANWELVRWYVNGEDVIGTIFIPEEDNE